MTKKLIAIVVAMLPLQVLAHPGHGVQTGLLHEAGHMGLLVVAVLIIFTIGRTGWRRYGR